MPEKIQDATEEIRLRPSRLVLLAELLIGTVSRDNFVMNAESKSFQGCSLNGNAGEFYDFINYLAQISKDKTQFSRTVYVIGCSEDDACNAVHCPASTRKICIPSLIKREKDKFDTDAAEQYGVLIGEKIPLEELRARIQASLVYRSQNQTNQSQ